MDSMKKMSFLMFASIVLALCSCKGSDGKRAEDVYVVKVGLVQGEDEGDCYEMPGRVVAGTEASVSFKVPGRLRRIYVKEGDVVRAGQTLAELDPVDYRTQLDATEAEYQQVKADAERVMGLYADGATTASNYDKARYGLKQMEAKLEHHRQQLEDTRLTAPFDGVVQKCHFDGFETVAAGMPIVSVQSGGSLEVEVSLPASVYLRRAGLSSYRCVLDVMPDSTYELQPVSISPKANANQLYTMRLRLDSRCREAAAGMSAWVYMSGACEDSGRVRVPTTALAEEGGKTYAYIYDKGTGTVARRPVVVLSLHTDGTASLTDGVRAGETIVTSGIHRLKDGARVTPCEPVSKTNVGGML